jgi:hypothetical protein
MVRSCPEGSECPPTEWTTEEQCNKVPYYGYEIDLKKGWNLVGTPLYNMESVEEDCGDLKIYGFDSGTGAYIEVPEDQWWFTAWWIKVDSDCTVKTKAPEIKWQNKIVTMLSYTGFERAYPLENGWHLLPGPYEEIEWEALEGTCETVSGPWEFDAESAQWIGADVLEPGKAYFVKVNGDDTFGDKTGCFLTQQTDQPPVLPG